MTEICSPSISQHCFMSFKIMTSSGFVYRIILLANNPKNQHTCIRSVITKSYINLEIMFEMESKSCNVLRQLLLSNDLPSYGSMLKIWFCANKPAKWNGLHKSLYSNKHGINKTKSWTQLIHVYHTQYQESGSYVTIETTQYTLASYKYKLNTLFVLCELLES